MSELSDGDIEHLIVRLKRPLSIYHFAMGMLDKVDMGMPHTYSERNIKSARSRKQRALDEIRLLLS